MLAFEELKSSGSTTPLKSHQFCDDSDPNCVNFYAHAAKYQKALEENAMQDYNVDKYWSFAPYFIPLPAE